MQNAREETQANDGPGEKGGKGHKPYRRDDDDDFQPESVDSEEGEEIVIHRGLDDRTTSRRTRKQQEEGYLDSNLGLRQRSRRVDGTISETDETDYDDSFSHRELTPARSILPEIRTPVSRHGSRRSPTPVQVITRALSPMIDRRPQSRKQRPTTSRTVITNILHGIVLALKFVCEAALAALHTLCVRPFHALFGSGKKALASLRRDWWLWLLGLLGLSLFLKGLDAVWQARAPHPMPGIPVGCLEDLIGRVTSLEQAVNLLSESHNLLADAVQGEKVDDSILARLAELEANRRIASSDKLKTELDSLRKQVSDLTGRVGKNEVQWKGVSGRIDGVNTDVQTLRHRVHSVEQSFKSVLEDGRLASALERILPRYLPVRISSGGTIDIDPVFWTEMRKMLVGKGEVESLVRSAIAGSATSEKDLEAWGKRFIERKTNDGSILSRAEFVRHLEGEVANLRESIETLPRHQASASTSTKSPSVTIKSTKGDDITALLQDLIDDALLRYSKDIIARPDYALFTAGARIIPSITSDTLVMRSPGLLGRLVLGQKPVEGRSPATALHPDISVGSCWPFAGSTGQLGVLLNRRVKVSDITLEHASTDVALDVSTAPRDVEVVRLLLRGNADV